MVGNLYDPADGRVHYATVDPQRVPVTLTKCQRRPADNYTPDPAARVDCSECLAIELCDTLLAGIHEHGAEQRSTRPLPLSMAISRDVAMALFRSRFWAERTGALAMLDGDGGTIRPLFGVPVELDDNLPGLEWCLYGANGKRFTSGRLGELAEGVRL